MEENEPVGDILYDIDMQLYGEFNDKIATMYDYLGECYGYSDIEEMKQREMEREIELLRNAVRRLQEENKRLIRLVISNDSKRNV